MQPSGSSYRNAPPRCPGCASVMEERGPADARIDVCRACGGVWLDWFDGEVTALARAVDQASLGRTGAGGSPTVACPRCQTALGEERFGGAGPEVLRCADCQGLFLSHEVVPLVAALDPSGEPTRQDAGPVDRLVAALRRLLGAS